MAIKLIDATKEDACRTAEANAIRAKTGSNSTITYDFDDGKGFSDAIAAIPTSSAPVLQTKSKSYTPTESAQSEDVEADNGYDGLEKVSVSVAAISSSYVGSGITRRDSTDLSASGATVTAPAGYYASSASLAVASGTAGTPSATKGSVSNHAITVTPSVTNVAGYISGGTINGTGVSVTAAELVSDTYSITAPGLYDVTNYQKASVPMGEDGTPVATKGTVSNHEISVTPSVTNVGGYIASGTKTGTAVSVAASELVSGTYSVTSSGTKDVTNYQYASIPAGTAGTPSASKGTVSNHAVTVTPSVTNAAGYISGGTISGTGVSVSASELVSGSKSITSNGSGQDVTNYATINVSVPNSYAAGDEGKVVSSGALVSQSSDTYTINGTYDTTLINSVTVDVSGGGSVHPNAYYWDSTTLSSASSSISFALTKANDPVAFFMYYDGNLSTGAAPYKTALVVYDGTNLVGQYVTNTNNAQMTYNASGWSKSYSNGTLTITGTNSNFQAGTYYLCYFYGGEASDIVTKSVQVGSGATSITFTDVDAQTDILTDCIVFFTSSFGTSSGYSRVAWVYVYLDEMDTTGGEMTNQLSLTNHWSASFSNGNFVLSSSSASSGGYFHQPGYYTLLYVKKNSGSSELQIPDPWADTTGGSVASTTVTALGSSFTAEKGGRYRVNAFLWRTNTSGTWSCQFYINGTAQSFGSVSWNGNRGTMSTYFTLAKDDVVTVRGSSRGTSYTLYLIGWTAAFADNA